MRLEKCQFCSSTVDPGQGTKFVWRLRRNDYCWSFGAFSYEKYVVCVETGASSHSKYATWSLSRVRSDLRPPSIPLGMAKESSPHPSTTRHASSHCKADTHPVLCGSDQEIVASCFQRRRRRVPAPAAPHRASAHPSTSPTKCVSDVLPLFSSAARVYIISLAMAPRPANGSLLAATVNGAAAAVDALPPQRPVGGPAFVPAAPLPSVASPNAAASPRRCTCTCAPGSSSTSASSSSSPLPPTAPPLTRRSLLRGAVTAAAAAALAAATSAASPSPAAAETTAAPADAAPVPPPPGGGCKNCRGGGKVACELCSGTGFWRAIANNDANQKYKGVVCPQCEGVGNLVCPVCLGTGEGNVRGLLRRRKVAPGPGRILQTNELEEV